MYEAEDADEAIRMMEAHPDVTLLFTDVDMPGDVDGVLLAEIVQARWPDVRLIVTSGRANFTDDEMPDDGHFIAKPYYAETIRSAIRDAFGT